MGVYVQPVFNLLVNIFRAGSPPPAAPTLQCNGNLSPGKIVGNPPLGGFADVPLEGGMWLRVPQATDIQDKKNGGTGDIVECPAWSGRYYNVAWVDDIGGGFANEHRFAILAPRGVWPLPFPDVFGPYAPPPPPGPVAFQAPQANNSGGIPVAMLPCGPSVLGAATDIVYYALMMVNPTMLGWVVTENGVVLGSPVGGGPLLLGPNVAWLQIYKGVAGIGAKALLVTMPLGGFAVMLEASVIITNTGGVASNAVGAMGAFPPAPTVALGGAGVVSAQEAVIYAVAGLATVLPDTCVAPVVDFLPPQLFVVALQAVTLAFGGDPLPPLGPYVCNRLSGVGAEGYIQTCLGVI